MGEVEEEGEEADQREEEDEDEEAADDGDGDAVREVRGAYSRSVHRRTSTINAFPTVRPG